MFKLNDTFGFPLDLTKEIAAEQGIEIDEEGFHAEMTKQKERARAAVSYTHLDVYKRQKQLREVNKKLDILMKAIEDGLYTRTTKERLEALEIQKDELTAKIDVYKRQVVHVGIEIGDLIRDKRRKNIQNCLCSICLLYTSRCV